MSSKPHLLHIDCLRGYAILMVMACHTAGLFRDLPWRFSQLFSGGWHGVQLFFLASTLTLLMSADWEADRSGRVDWVKFFIRRFFRIAPAYYAAAVIYVLLNPERWQSSWGTIAFALFLNSWLPFKFGQALVPGGWSISVEFSFYLLFPWIAAYCHSVRRAALLLAGSIVIACTANSLALRWLAESLSAVELGNYVYFSFWNQLPIFSLANLVYHAAYRPVIDGAAAAGGTGALARRAGLTAAFLALATAAYLPLPRSFGGGMPWVPNFLFSAVCLSVICVIAAREWPRWLINPVVARLGQVSFSAYLWHWLVLETFSKLAIGQWLLGQSQFAAMGAYCVALMLVVGATWLLASVSYRLVEVPGMALGRKLVRRSAVPVVTAV